jgi:hypothetical protein
MSQSFAKLDACALCGLNKPLSLSHIIPNFAFKRLRAYRGYFIEASAPKHRRQNGAVVRLLCASCEQVISPNERAFQRSFFPKGERAALPIQYGNWMLPFATSLSWRALSFLKYSRTKSYRSLSAPAERLLPKLPEQSFSRANEALLTWADILNGRTIEEGEFPQHIVFLNGRNVKYEHPRVAAFNVYVTTDTTAVISQIGPVCILGIIESSEDVRWTGTRISPSGGIFSAEGQGVPPTFLKWLRNYYSDMNEIIKR